MAATKTVSVDTERQNVAQMYKDLSEGDRIIFKSILEMAIILLKNIQEAERRTK